MRNGVISANLGVCNCRWGSAAGGGSGGVVAGDSSEEEEEQDAKIGRAEELRRERLTALVKRNLTTILLEVTDAMFGARLPLTSHPWEEGVYAEVALHETKDMCTHHPRLVCEVFGCPVRSTDMVSSKSNLC